MLSVRVRPSWLRTRPVATLKVARVLAVLQTASGIRCSMRFKTNYGQQGMERALQARAKQSEKLEKLREKSEQRKPELDGAPLYRGDDDPGMETSIQPADGVARPFDYQAAAELFLAKRSG